MKKITSFQGRKSKRFIEAPNCRASSLKSIKEYNVLREKVQTYSSIVSKQADKKARRKLAITVMKLIELEEMYEIVNEEDTTAI